jgi:hypothetical protein
VDGFALIVPLSAIVGPRLPADHRTQPTALPGIAVSPITGELAGEVQRTTQR